MRDAVTIAFELVTLATLVLPVAIAVLASRPRGRRLLRHWFRFSTFVWCEAEGTVSRPDDPAAITEALDSLRAALPHPEQSLFPRVFVVRIVEPAAGEAACQLAATLRRFRSTPDADETPASEERAGPTPS